MINTAGIQHLRQVRGLSQAKLGKLIGADSSYINRLEHDPEYDIRSERLCRLADALECSTDFLLGRDGNMRAA